MSTEEKETKRKAEDNGDPFWSRILIFTIIVVWIALVAGNWIGHYIIQAGVLAKKSSAYNSEFKHMPAAKPKPWKMPVKVIEPTKAPEKDFTSPVFDNSKTPKVKPSAVKSPKPTKKPKASPTPTPTPSKKPKPSPTPTPTPSKKPKPSPTPTPSPSKKPKPSPTPTPTPSKKPSPSPTPSPSKKPTPKPTPTPSAKVTPSPSPAKQTGSFSLQAGNFNKHENAVERADTLKAKGYSALVVKVGDRYKVFVGSYKSREAASAATEKLKTDGFDSFVVSDK